VFQQAALFPHISVSDNIEYGLRARRMPSPERVQRRDGIVEALGLAPVLSRPVPTLSGGEAQRVAIARALAIRPEILLLDEPLSLLDHNARLDLRDELARVHRELELTTLHVTHSRDEARSLGDHVAVMVGGYVVQRGTTEEVFARPACRFVAAFLGCDSSDSDEPLPCDSECPARAACSYA
jgi:molybdate/tungstate transport system ATP-binding protein